MHKIKCAECKNSFVKKKSNQRYCSPLCYQRGWAHENKEYYNARMRAYSKAQRAKNRGSRICLGCKNVFVCSHGLQKYCSKRCHDRHTFQNNKERAYGFREKYTRKTKETRAWQFLLMSAKARAKKRNLSYNLNKEWAATNWNGHCAMTGIEFVVNASPYHALAPSLDRIESSKGYTQNNCRFILWAVNRFKGSWDDSTIHSIAQALITSDRKDSQLDLAAHSLSSAA